MSYVSALESIFLKSPANIIQLFQGFVTHRYSAGIGTMVNIDRHAGRVRQKFLQGARVCILFGSLGPFFWLRSIACLLCKIFRLANRQAITDDLLRQGQRIFGRYQCARMARR